MLALIVVPTRLKTAKAKEAPSLPHIHPLSLQDGATRIPAFGWQCHEDYDRLCRL